MECVVPKRSLKIFSKVIQCLGKVGEELFFEPAADKLVFRTLNQARSAFVAVTFSPTFFEVYTLAADTVVSKCKIQLKSCLAVFRSVSTVEKCTMRLDEAESRLVVELQCKMGIKKTYKLTFEECESLQAVYSKENCPNKLISQPRLLIDIVNNFHSNLDEISFVVTEKMFKVKSYIDDEKKSGPARVLQTELTVDPKNFEEYIVGSNVGDITFCLKEFKALLQFCEAAGQAISIWFDQGGRPILFSVNFFNAFEVDFVLATLLDSGSSSSQSSSAPDSASQTPSNSARHSKQAYSAPPASTPPSSMADSILGSSQGRGSQTPTPTPAGQKMDTYEDSASPNPSSSSYVRGTLPSDGGATSVTSSMVEAIGTDKRQRSTSKQQHQQQQAHSEAEGEEEEEDEYVEGTPPSSPPVKKTRKGN